MQALSLSSSSDPSSSDEGSDEEEGVAPSVSSRRAVRAVQVAALSRISTEAFELLSAEQQEQLFDTLLRINSAGQTAAATLVAQLPFDSAVFAKRLAMAGGKKKDKMSAAATAGSDVAAVQAVLELLQLKDPQRSLRSPFALVSPLFQLLEQLSLQSKEGGADASKLQSFEYCKQLCMAALNRFLAIPAEGEEAASGKKSKKAASGGFNVKDINVDAVVACLSASGEESQPTAAAVATTSSSVAGAAHASLHTLNVSLENTRSHALTLLSLIGKSHPELIVDKLQPIFQMLLVHSTHSADSQQARGAANAVTSAMEVDGEPAAAAADDSEPYALRLLNQLISTVLPSIVAAKLQWNVWQLLGVFVDSLAVRSSASGTVATGKSLKKKSVDTLNGASASVVNRRRLHLFHNLLTSLQVRDDAGAATEDSDNYLHVVVALLLAKSVTEKSAKGVDASSAKASLLEFAHALCEQFGDEPVVQIRAFNSLLQLLSSEIDAEHGELLAAQQKHVGAPLKLGAKSSRSKKGAAVAAGSDGAHAASPLSSLLRTPAQISSWQKGVLSFLSQHLARLSFAQQIYLHAKRTQQAAGAGASEGEQQDEIQTSFLHLFEHLFARLRSSLQLSKHLSSASSSSASLSNHFLLLSTHTKQALLHLNGLLTMPNFVRILQELFRISGGGVNGEGKRAQRDLPLILQALSLLNSKLISYKDRAKINSFAGGKSKKMEEEADEPGSADADVDMSDPNSAERVIFYRNKKAEQRLLVSLLPALQQLLEVEPAAVGDATSTSNSDLAAMKQSALLNLEMLTSSFGHMRQFQAEFVQLFPSVLQLTALPRASEGKEEEAAASASALLHSHSWQHISTSAMLCLATLVSACHAKAHVMLLEFIPQMVPNTLAILQQINAPVVAPATTAKKSGTKSSKGQANKNKKRKHDDEEEEEESGSEEEEESDASQSLQTLDTLAAPLLQLSALSLLQACIMSVADLLSPYLADLLKVLLFPGYHNHAGGASAASSMALLASMSSVTSMSAAAAASSAASASSSAASSSSVDHSSISTVVSQSLTSLIHSVQSRTILPVIFNHYKVSSAQGYASLRRLFHLLGLVVQELKSEAIKQHFKLIFKFFLAAAQQLRKAPLVDGGAAADRYGVTLSQAEDALIASFLELTMKLNETSFKGLFLKMLQWVGPIPNSVEAQAAVVVVEGGGNTASSTHDFLNRSLVFFKLIHQLTGKLKGIFVTYFGYILDHCVVFLNAPKKAAAAAAAASAMEDEESAEDEDGEDGSGPAAKKRKHEDGSASASAKSASSKVLLSAGIAGGVPSELIDLVLHSLRNCFLYDSQHFLDRHHFQQLTAPMVQQLQYAFNTRGGGAKAAAAQGKHAHEAYDEFITHTITPTIVQMAIRMGNYLQWKPLVSALMLHGRSPSSAVRRASVFVFEQLFVSIGDNLLVILPELLPWIAELREDGDVGVERNVDRLVKIIEKLSGESLDATLG